MIDEQDAVQMIHFMLQARRQQTIGFDVLFAAVGRYDQIAKAIEARFGGLVDSVSASASASKPADLPPDLIQDIARIPTRYRPAT